MKENPREGSDERDWRRPRYLPTGRLRFEITEYYPDPKPRLSWTDGKKQRLEEVLGDIIRNLEFAGERAKQWHLELQERERKRHEEAERRLEAKRQRALEAARVAALERQVADWARSRQIREYVEASRARLETIEDETARHELERWLDWGLEHAGQLEQWPPSTEPDPLPDSWQYHS